tara:strand:- start:27 stop:221 length:195 start_codon:yes stop_codon:yes gene_type:complete
MLPNQNRTTGLDIGRELKQKDMKSLIRILIAKVSKSSSKRTLLSTGVITWENNDGPVTRIEVSI